MKSIFYDHFEVLSSIKPSEDSAVSIFVPMGGEVTNPTKLLRTLLSSANRLMEKDGKPPVTIELPDWSTWSKSDVLTIGIFHYQEETTIIPLPIKMQPRVVVASSFHLKPVLAALDEISEGLQLHFDQDGASLYRVHAFGQETLCRFRPTRRNLSEDWANLISPDKLLSHLDDIAIEIEKSLNLSAAKVLMISGIVSQSVVSKSRLSSLSIPCEITENSSTLSSATETLRVRLAEQSNLERALLVTKILKETRHPELTIETLAEKILNQEIETLCVSLEDLQFGELNGSSGKVSKNKLQLSSRDDDLLDDIAELAIKKGVEVKVVPRKFLPPGRFFLAS